MTSVMGTLVLVAMTGLTITNHHRNQNTATGKSLEPGVLLRPSHEEEISSESAKELERALAKEDAALWASYERYQKHPRNVQKKEQRGHAAAAAGSVDPMVNSVYSLNTKSELTAGSDGAEFVVRQDRNGAGDDDPSRPRAIPTTATEQATTDGHQPQQEVVAEERPFDFYDPSLTAEQKREYVKKVVYFSPYIVLFL